MGMTDDFEVAVEEGATIVRVGRALFGERPHDHAHRLGRGPPALTTRKRVDSGSGEPERRPLRRPPDPAAGSPIASTAWSTGCCAPACRRRAVEGAANQALLRLLAAELGVPRRDVRLIAGAGGRTKLVVVDGVDARGVRGALARPAPLIASRSPAGPLDHAAPRRGPGD